MNTENDPGIWKEMLTAAILLATTVGGWLLRHTHGRIDRAEVDLQRLWTAKADEQELKDVFNELREIRKEMNANFHSLVDRVNARH
jgi:hypothetical protein